MMDVKKKGRPKKVDAVDVEAEEVLNPKSFVKRPVFSDVETRIVITLGKNNRTHIDCGSLSLLDTLLVFKGCYKYLTDTFNKEFGLNDTEKRPADTTSGSDT